MREVAEKSDDGVVYAPSVTGSDKLPEILRDSGFQLIHVRSSEDLPSSAVAEKTVLVVDLPPTEQGPARGQNLQRNGMHQVVHTPKLLPRIICCLFSLQEMLSERFSKCSNQSIQI